MYSLLLTMTLLAQVGPTPQPPPGPAPAPAPLPAPFISLPRTIECAVGDKLEIKVATTAKDGKVLAASWDDFPKGFTCDVLDGGLRLLAWADEGQYALRVNAYDDVSKKICHAQTVVVLTRKIAPVPPPPPDKLKADLATLLGPPPFSADTLKWGGQISALYRAASKFAVDDSVLTPKMLVEDIAGAIADKKIPADTLKAVRARVIAELVALSIDMGATMSTSTRAKVADVYTRSADALDGALK